MTVGTKNHHVEIGADQVSDVTRGHRSEVVGTMATTTPRYQADATFKAVIDEQVAAGVELTKAAGNRANADALAKSAKAAVRAKRRAWGKANAAAVAQVQKHDPTEEEIKSYGYEVQGTKSQVLVAPSDILRKYDVAKALLRLHVLWALGRQECVIEISTDPIGAATWVQLDGHGCKRALAGYAPGTYWIRAATVRAKVRSAWFGPVAVVVK